MKKHKYKNMIEFYYSINYKNGFFFGSEKEKMKNTPFSLQYYFGVIIKLWGGQLSFFCAFLFSIFSKKSFFEAFLIPIFSFFKAFPVELFLSFSNTPSYTNKQHSNKQFLNKQYSKLQQNLPIVSTCKFNISKLGGNFGTKFWQCK